jgi:hypothetical protein
MRGGKKPLLVELTSSEAEAFGLLVPTPTCEYADAKEKKSTNMSMVGL